MSQIGFITTGIGIACLTAGESEMASTGTVLHMVNHSLIKLLLFSCAGVVYMNLHKLALSDVRGWGRNKPLLALYFAAGALTISGVPGTSGYISKTLLHESIVEVIEELEHAGESIALLKGLEWVFLISGGLTFAYMTRLFFCLFVRKNRTEAVQKEYTNKIAPYMNRLSAFVIALPAVALVCTGAVYWQHHYYTWTNLKGSLTSLAIGACIMLVLRGKDTKELKFDLEDNVYRPVLLGFLVPVMGAAAKLLSRAGDAAFGAVMPLLAFIARGIANFADGFVKLLQSRLLRQIQPHEERFSPMDWLKGHSLTKRWQEIHLDVLDFANSLSFGLLMAITGLCIFLIYIITH